VGGEAEAQLRVIHEVGDRFSTFRIRFWLRGGWAVDFMLGRVTRPHDDVDLVIWARHRRRARQVLTEAGFTVAREFDAQTDFRAYGQVLSIAYLARNEDGQIITHGIPVWLWPEETLGRRVLQLEGAAARVIGPRQLLWEKESYERGVGRPLRPKDVVSMQTLREIIAAGTPERL
jgi:hypothetical protein